MRAPRPLPAPHTLTGTGTGTGAGTLTGTGTALCVPQVWEGENVVKVGRQMIGETDPQASLPGTIRGDFSIEVGRNICHGSDSVENAEKEIALCTLQPQPGSRAPPQRPPQRGAGGAWACGRGPQLTRAAPACTAGFKPEELVEWDDHSNDWIYE